MDYEKKYNEALERARGLHGTVFVAAQDLTEQIFPELRESEDERIRKLLVWQVYRNIEDETNDLAGSVYDGIKGHDPDIEESIEDWKKCLAYLEKQKEQKDYRKLYEDIAKSEWFKKAYEGKSLGYDDEQKPAQTSEEKEYIRTLKSLISDFIRDKQPEDVVYYQRVYDWLDGRHVEQKPAEWNEEDENNLKRAINICVNDFGEESETAKFLKSLPERFNIQPKNEWSEEDEAMIKSILFVLESYVSEAECEQNPALTATYPTYYKEIDWLKSKLK